MLLFELPPVTFDYRPLATLTRSTTAMADAKQGKTPHVDFHNGSSQSRVVLAKPRLGGFGSSSFASSSSKGCNPFGAVLRPSQLKPGINPFLKISDPIDNVDKEKEKEAEPSTEDRLKDDKEEVDTPKFVPLGSANVTARTANPVPVPVQPTTSSSSGFVFGQNLSERVVMENTNNGEAAPADHSSTNGTTELLFTSAAASVKENNQDEPGPSESHSHTNSSGEGLAAAAAEYERSHARPPPPTTNYTTTGEEGEINVLQISCRLFAWESGSWRERGRGVLRLNDASAGGGAAPAPARLVARVAGSLRVILNTKLWPDMVVEQAGTKSLRITAADAQQQVKLFLIMGAPSDIAQLNKALATRIAVSKRTNISAQNSSSQKAAERLEAAADADEFLEAPADDSSGSDQPDYVPDPSSLADKQKETTSNDRLEQSVHNAAEESDVDNETEEDKTKALKRKEPAEDETQSKRQCPDILIE